MDINDLESWSVAAFVRYKEKEVWDRVLIGANYCQQVIPKITNGDGQQPVQSLFT